MKEEDRTYRIFSLAKRVQHLLFTAGFTASLLTGLALYKSGGMVQGAAMKVFPSLSALYWWHALFGIVTASVLGAHILYLVIRSYVEDIPFWSFPLKFGPGEVKGLAGEARDLISGRPRAVVRYPPSRRFFYWIFLFPATAIIASGTIIFFWDWLDYPLLTGRLDGMASVHAGVSLVLAVLSVWHAYGIAGGGRKLSLLKLTFSGRINGRDLAAFYPDEYRRIREGEKKKEEEWRKTDKERLEEVERAKERKMIEGVLDEGNRLAREKRYLEAAEEYRRALENFPGYSQAQYNLALVLEKAQRPGEALDEYRRFLEIDPFHDLSDGVRQAIHRLEE